MLKTYINIPIRPDTAKRLRIDVKDEFLRHHPEFEGMRLTDDFIMRKIIDFYLEN